MAIIDRRQRVGRASPDGEDVLAFFAVLAILEGIEQALGRGGEVGGVLWQVFFIDNLATLLFKCFLVSGNAVTTKSIILRDGRYANPRHTDGHRVGDGVLRRVASDTDHIAVPRFAGDRIGHTFRHNDTLILFGD